MALDGVEPEARRGGDVEVMMSSIKTRTRSDTRCIDYPN